MDPFKGSFFYYDLNILKKKNDMKNWTSVRAVYLLMSIVLTSGLILDNWYIVVFVIAMLNIGVWTKFCPSKWLFEKLGLKKSEL